MSFPFGGHPKLSRFLELAEEQGCVVSLSVRATREGKPYQSLVVVAPSGAQVVIVNPDMDEFLAPSTVAYYQRRLGVKTHFASTPEVSPSDTPTERGE